MNDKYDVSRFINFLRKEGSIILSKKLIHVIGINATIIYSELLSRYDYFYKRKHLTEDGYFYNTVDDLRLGTGLAKDAQNTAIDKLKEVGLIKKKLSGLPAKRHFKIVNDIEKIKTILKQGEREISKLEAKMAEKADISRSRVAR